MANALYTPYKLTALGNGTAVDVDTDNFRINFIDHAVNDPDVVNDDFLDDIVSGEIAESGNLVSPTILAAGAMDTDDITVTSVSGAQFESVNLFKETGTDSTSDLIAHYDTATGLPFTPSGGDITVVVNGSGWYSF